jgi:hypothetical protein
MRARAHSIYWLLDDPAFGQLQLQDSEYAATALTI